MSECNEKQRKNTPWPKRVLDHLTTFRKYLPTSRLIWNDLFKFSDRLRVDFVSRQVVRNPVDWSRFPSLKQLLEFYRLQPEPVSVPK